MVVYLCICGIVIIVVGSIIIGVVLVLTFPIWFTIALIYYRKSNFEITGKHFWLKMFTEEEVVFVSGLVMLILFLGSEIMYPLNMILNITWLIGIVFTTPIFFVGLLSGVFILQVVMK